MQHIHSHQTLQPQKQATQHSQQPQAISQQKNEPQIQQHSQHILEFHPSTSQSHVLSQSHAEHQPQAQVMSHSHLLTDKSAKDPLYPPPEPHQSPPRAVQHEDPPQQPSHRPRPLSREDGGDNPFLVSVEQSQGSKSFQDPQKGGSDGPPRVLVAEEVKAAPTGVIQSTRRKRRVSQEANLETLAQKASEMESLPSHIVKVRVIFICLFFFSFLVHQGEPPPFIY